MIRWFLPRQDDFFALFDKQADAAIEAAELFRELVSKGAIDDASLRKMETIEHEGDDATYALIAKLNKTFITPFDREDIHALAKELDDVIDVINTMVGKLRVYSLTGVNKNLVEFAGVIDQSVRRVASAVKGLRDMKRSKAILQVCIEINHLEDLGDSMRDRSIAELFETEKNPINVIKWKEIYEDAETVLDICEDVANVVEGVALEYS